MNVFWYGYIIPKYQNNVKICQMDTDSFIIHTKIEGFYKDIADDVKNRYDTSNYRVDRPLPKGGNKKVIDFNERWTRRNDNNRISST